MLFFVINFVSVNEKGTWSGGLEEAGEEKEISPTQCLHKKCKFLLSLYPEWKPQDICNNTNKILVLFSHIKYFVLLYLLTDVDVANIYCNF
jgi:hypothetical protein